MELPLKHSIENIFAQVGQYDRYAIFDFYYNSTAYKEYGSTVYGDIIYTPSERKRLTEIINSESIGHNDGIILLKGAGKNEQINAKLKAVGFKAMDISRLATMDHEPIKNEYGNTGLKQIPGTIEIEFDSGKFNLWRGWLHNFELRIESGSLLISYEYQKYMTLLHLFYPLEYPISKVNDYICDPDTTFFYNDVTITVFSYLSYEQPSDKQIKATLIQALKKREKERVALICRQLGIAPRHLESFKTTERDKYNELYRVVLGFEPETISVIGWKYSIYWDFDRFIHIYLRHYKQFYIESSSKGQGTTFQYKYKDIRRLINIVLSNNKDEIQQVLSEGRPFNIYNDGGYYYNGNYYTFKINKEGKLMQFHPQEI